MVQRRSALRAPRLGTLSLAFTLCLALLAGCGGPAPELDPTLRIAVLMPAPPFAPQGTRPALEWALEGVRNAGGVAGRQLALEYVPYDPMQGPEALRQTAASVASDPSYVAAIGPGTSSDLVEVADSFLAADKPLVSFTSTAADVLRAYGGRGFLFRTRESDIAQAELFVRYAREQGVARLALVSSLAVDGFSFFSWFGFFARDRGYPESAVHIEPLPQNAPCEDAIAAALATQPDMLFVAGSTPNEVDCAVRAVRARAMTGAPRLVLADTGLDIPTVLRQLGPLAEGVEGMSPVSPPNTAFDDAFRSRFETPPPPHGASEYDAVLLLAYGLERSRGRGGSALIAGIKAAVDGHDEGPFSWDAPGIAATLQALRAGRNPNPNGATGSLDLEPGLYTDLAASFFSHWQFQMGRRAYDRTYFTGDSGFRTGERALVTGAPTDVQELAATGGGYVPAKDKGEVWAVIAALSSGFANYRHQADALRQYRLLRSNGVPDDHIVLVLADDVAAAQQNPLPGIVRNELGGPDLRKGAEIDYRLPLTPLQLADIIAGRASAATPQVVHTSDASNLYVYLVGHGGPKGIAIGATSASQGQGLGQAGGAATVFSPALLRSALCSLSSSGRLRRALIAIESCNGGVFGEASGGGLAAGCPGTSSGPPGVVLLSAANSHEVSIATSYDPHVGVWLADAFSQQVARFAEQSTSATVADLYRKVYFNVPGSHVSLYNDGVAGPLSTVPLSEFFAAW